jgi:hypothetical protein
MRFIYFIIGFLFFSCEKERLPESKKISIAGLYVFKKVTISIIDNSTQKGNAYYDNGMTFINPNEVDGLDTIITDFSLIKIKNNKIYLNAEILNTDTIWETSYDCEYSDFDSFNGGNLTFYPIGSKRDCYIESFNGKEYVINPPLIWPYSSSGPAYSLVYLLQKINK